MGRALSEYQQMDRLLQTGHVGEAVTPPGPAIRIPAGSLQFVQATCNQGPGPAIGTVLLEPLPYGKGRLPMNLLISSALLTVSRGTVNIPVVNVAPPVTLALLPNRSQPQTPSPQRLALCPWKNLQVSQRAIHPLLKGQKQPFSSCWDQR
ncbi:hypothetical protein N1851_014258 [Merluccius polli]|uniref:Uncharacterized protein n=1 Tax=Merluccius polli TaxID=89951 RepID=A0AA47P114_MERPO|nr:hypothetical protein N1851_014258 [Merluccius polli]